MALHIQDPETDRILRDFARRRGVGITEAVKLAVTEAEKASTARVESLRERIEPILAKVRAEMKRNGTTAADVRRFIDDGWDGL